MSKKIRKFLEFEDRVFRAKVKSALVKAKKLATVNSNLSAEKEGDSSANLNADNPNVKIGKLIEQKFPNSLSDSLNEEFIGLKREKWVLIAEYIKSNSDIYIDSLQCITGVDLGENVFVKIPITNNNPVLPKSIFG
mgnify:CR=1 FL=1